MFDWYRVAKWVIGLFAIFYVATQPQGAAHVVHNAYNGLHAAAQSLSEFINAL